MRAAIVIDGVVTNIIETSDKIENSVFTKDVPVRIGDSFDGTNFYRNGELIGKNEGLDSRHLTLSEAIDYYVSLLIQIGVDVGDPQLIRNPTPKEQIEKIKNGIRSVLIGASDDVVLNNPTLIEKWDFDRSYVKNDTCKYDGILYRCIQSHTSQSDWVPPAAVSLWVKIANPEEEWPTWIQPTGAHDAYAKDAKVTHNGKHWTSNVDSNVWEPGAYGWTEANQ